MLLSAVPVLLRHLHAALPLLVSTLGIDPYALPESVPPQAIWCGRLICVYTVARHTQAVITANEPGLITPRGLSTSG